VLAGQTIGRIEAVDHDTGPNADIIYGLDRDAGTDYDMFSIDPETGVLSANVNLQPHLHDNSTNYSLIVTASNPSQSQGHMSSTRSVLQVIIDKPIAPLYGQRRPSFVLTGHSMVAIVTVGAVSAVVIIVLLVAIAVVLCRQRRRTKDLVTSAVYDVAPIDSANDNKVHRQISGSIPPTSASGTDTALLGNTTTQSNINPGSSANTPRDVTANKMWKPSAHDIDVSIQIIIMFVK